MARTPKENVALFCDDYLPQLTYGEAVEVFQQLLIDIRALKGNPTFQAAAFNALVYAEEFIDGVFCPLRPLWERCVGEVTA